jgi:hypothetical protein
MAKKDEEKQQAQPKKAKVDRGRSRTPVNQRTGVHVNKAPEHTRAPGDGYRSTVGTFEEIRAKNYEIAQEEDYSETESRATKFGPNRSESNWKPKKNEDPFDAAKRLAYEQAKGEGPQDDVEDDLAEAGKTMVSNPDRFDPSSDKYKGAGQAPDPVEAARQESDKDALTADKNYGDAHLTGKFDSSRGLRG